MNIKHFLQVLIPHLYGVAAFLPSPLPLQNFKPHGYHPIHNSNEHVQGAHMLDVSAHLVTNNDLESFVPCGPKKLVLKLRTAAISDSSEEPNKLKNNVLLTINS